MKKFDDSHFFVYPAVGGKLGTMIINCGHECATEQSYSFDGLKRGPHETAIWQYTLSGCGCFEFGKDKYELPPGRAFFALVPEKHCYYLPKTSSHWEFIYLTLHGVECINLFREYRRNFGTVADFAADSDVLKLAWRFHDMAKNKKTESAYSLSSDVYNFIMTVFRESHNALSNGEKSPEWLQKVKDFCAKNMDSDIMVDDMARIANCSKWHFSREFLRCEGVPPHKYLMDLRIKFALIMLKSSELSIKEIAEKCGFYDLAYFGKVFKSVMGMSPGEYRK